MPNMAADVRFSDMSLRSKNIDDLYKISSKVFPTRSTSEWLELLAEADIPVGQVNTLQELKNDPHLTQLFEKLENLPLVNSGGNHSTKFHAFSPPYRSVNNPKNIGRSSIRNQRTGVAV